MPVPAHSPVSSSLDLPGLRQAISDATFLPEQEAVKQLLPLAETTNEHGRKVHDRALELVEHVRETTTLGVESFLQEYRLDHKEGILIMCLAEALLRIPDTHTANKLIEDKFSEAEWQDHIGNSESFMVNASAWGLMLTGAVLNFDRKEDAPLNALRRLVHTSGMPVVRGALRKAIEWMGSQFILGRSIEEGVKNAPEMQAKGFTYSYDMLGEGARTARYAEEYAERYLHAIETIGKSAGKEPDLLKRPGISIKLSALHPRYETGQKQKVMQELLPPLKKLLLAAKQHNMMASIDAEEAARLELSLDVFEKLAAYPDLKGWDGLSLVVQAYQKRAPFVIRWLAALARAEGRCIPLRLVKGAYWDSEIKHAQVHGAPGYPVYTRKDNTDLSYLACARLMLDAGDAFYPMFATHNAHTVASILELAGKDQPFEFQRLHGMGSSLYDYLVTTKKQARCRIYAPIGVHKDLLAYLVRRLLENGANSSFIHQVGDKNVPLEALVIDPVEKVKSFPSAANTDIPLPLYIYGAERKNSHGFDLGLYADVAQLQQGLAPFASTRWQATSLVKGRAVGAQTRRLVNPANTQEELGNAQECGEAEVLTALEAADKAFTSWSTTPASTRADIMRKAADFLEEQSFQFMAAITREGGRTVQDAIDEVREAVDFCRYYAAQAEKLAGQPTTLPGPTGELNQLMLTGRGVFVCISPWNFPLAIFMGQVVAALAAGNTVLAKPAEQTPIVAWLAVTLLHRAGVPEDALHLLLGKGSVLGKLFVKDMRVAGVVFTGSTETAQIINQGLAARGGPIVPLIAETGGQNAMITDSSALPEQVADDVISSSFTSAGQRCSALRVLYVQEDVADAMIGMIKGALEARVIGNPWEFSTDIGPVIDADAKEMLEAHKAVMKKNKATILHDVPLPTALTQAGHFVGPAMIEISGIEALEKEIFGPILHIVRYQAKDLDKVIDAINKTGYGLTLGVHSRIDDTIDRITSRARAGNIYVNRGMTGAVVGVQPFGGQGLSGTGPKAGGPHYLQRMMVERTVTVNISAIGGNVGLYM